MKAGQIALTVIFSFARTGPTERVRPTRARLAAAYYGFVVMPLISS
jgi:hypothetical protein